MIINMLMNKSQEIDGFNGRRQKVDFRHETEARKLMLDFKFDALTCKSS